MTGGGAIVDDDNIIYDEQGGIIEIPPLNNGRMSPKIPHHIVKGGHMR